MNFYYVIPNPNYKDKYIFNANIIESVKSIYKIQEELLSNPAFCRDQKSISTNELKSYLLSGISFFTENESNQITGLINFDINVKTLNIMGLCVPGTSEGLGSFLIKEVKEFAKKNSLEKITLTCYDDVVNFYKKQGFKVGNMSKFYDSDDESDDEEDKTRYNMFYNITTGGKRRKKMTVKKMTSKKQRKNNKKKTKKQK